MDIPVTTRRPGFCKRFGFSVPHPAADAHKDKYCGEHSARLGLNIHTGKSMIFKVNSTSTASAVLAEEDREEVAHFIYLESVVDTQGWTEADVETTIGKARVTCLQLRNIWKSKSFTRNNYQDFRYKCEGCSSAIFVNSCLRRILGVWWPETISNKQLWQRTCQMLVEQEI